MWNNRSDISGNWVLRCSCATCCGDRDQNEDNLRFGSLIEVTAPVGPLRAEVSMWMDQTQVFCVCDGIGGSARGELASRQALRALSRFLRKNDVRHLPMEELAAAAAEAAHSSVLNAYRSLGISGGCTMVMVILQGNRYTMLNIGDSPAFHYDAATRKFTQLSVEHSLHWLSQTTGTPCPPGEEHRLAYFLGREGAMARDMLHITVGTMGDGDAIMLCSDGVTNGIPERKRKKYVKQGRSAAYLVEKASGLPGADNCTAICLYARRLK